MIDWMVGDSPADTMNLNQEVQGRRGNWNYPNFLLTDEGHYGEAVEKEGLSLAKSILTHLLKCLQMFLAELVKSMQTEFVAVHRRSDEHQPDGNDGNRT